MPNGTRPMGRITLGAKPKIDVNSLEEVTCRQCGNNPFIKLNNIRIMPAIVSPVGQEGFVYIEHTVCAQCGIRLEMEGGEGNGPVNILLDFIP